MPIERDGDGRVIPHNDGSISDDDFVVRRIAPDFVVPTPDGFRVSKGAFGPSSRTRDPYCGLSVDLVSALEIDLQDYSPETEVLVVLRIGDIREELPELMIGRDPLSGNEAHCAIWRIEKTAQKKKLLSLARVVRPN